MESLQIAALHVIDKDQTFTFSLKLCLRKSTKKDKIKTEHAVTFRKKYSETKLLQFLRQSCCDQNYFPVFEMRTVLKTQLSYCINLLLLLQFTGD